MNKDFILRLTKYKRLLNKLKSLGFERVFSNNLGDAIGISPALVRKDFSTLNFPGNKRGGYNVDTLIESLDKLLGRDKPQRVVIVGCGRIGSALMQYSGFAADGLLIIAGFDKNPELITATANGAANGANAAPVLPMEKMKEFVQQENIMVGIIAVPDSEASKVLDQMIDAGIRGILNFAPVELKCSKAELARDCTIHNVNIALELEHLFYLVNAQKNSPQLMEKIAKGKNDQAAEE